MEGFPLYNLNPENKLNIVLRGGGVRSHTASAMCSNVLFENNRPLSFILGECDLKTPNMCATPF